VSRPDQDSTVQDTKSAGPSRERRSVRGDSSWPEPGSSSTRGARQREPTSRRLRAA